VIDLAFQGIANLFWFFFRLTWMITVGLINWAVEKRQRDEGGFDE